MARAISSGSATRPSGTPVASAAFLSAVPVKRVSIAVSVGPGATALTRLVVVAHIRTEELSFSAERAQLSYQLLAGFLVPTGNNGAVTFPRESPRRRTPDSS